MLLNHTAKMKNSRKLNFKIQAMCCYLITLVNLIKFGCRQIFINNSKSWYTLVRLLLFCFTLYLASCRCSTEYIPKAEFSPDSTIHATAHMWQGQYEYLSIDIEIKRTDSLFVKDIKVFPTINDKEFFPVFEHYEMYSYYFEKDGKYKGGPYWTIFSDKVFDQLPSYNRRTNIGDHFVKFKAFFQSQHQIDFEEFSAKIIVTLIDQSGHEFQHQRKFNFHGERNCRFSPH